MKDAMTRLLLLLLIGPAFGSAAASAGPDTPRDLRLAVFDADVTIPLGHRCMGVLPAKSSEIADPLEAIGFALLGADAPIVVVAFDWCEIRNGAYDAWRDTLARVAGTTRERVLISCLHQHDAPVIDSDAQTLLDAVGLEGELFDRAFHQRCLERVSAALARALKSPHRVTHVGSGHARVEQVASNRRVLDSSGRASFRRGSASGGDAILRDAPDGEIDPYLKTLSLWDGDRPILALHAYATHPMSYYGRGGVSADFVGSARRMRSREQPAVRQMYVSGCSGDVTAGKYNDGSAGMRPVLAARLQRAMQVAWNDTQRKPIETVALRRVVLDLPFHDGKPFSDDAMSAMLHNRSAKTTDRILAAMGLASRRRGVEGRKIDLVAIDFQTAQIVLFPGESFVAYQLLAQKLRPDSFVLCIGYGECWPGYIPTDAAFVDKFDEGWRWVATGCESRMRRALEQLLAPTAP